MHYMRRLYSKFILILIITLAMGVLTGCNREADESILDLGTYDDLTYNNEYFGIHATLPEGWTIQDHEVMNQLMEESTEAIEPDDDKKEQLKELMELSVLNLVFASKYPLEEQTPVNPNIIINAEKLSAMQGVSDEKVYLEMSKAMLEKTSIDYEFNEVYSKEIGGKELTVLETTIDLGEGNKMYQTYYNKLIEGYAFNIITTYIDSEGKEEIEAFIDTITFND